MAQTTLLITSSSSGSWKDMLQERRERSSIGVQLRRGYCGWRLGTCCWQKQEQQDQYEQVFNFCKWSQPNGFWTRWFEVTYCWSAPHSRRSLSLLGVHNRFGSRWQGLNDVFQNFIAMPREGCHFRSFLQLHRWETFCIRTKYGGQKSRDLGNRGIDFRV